MRVYCSECKYFREEQTVRLHYIACKHEKNKTVVKGRIFKKVLSVAKSPAELNKANKCIWYVPKGRETWKDRGRK